MVSTKHLVLGAVLLMALAVAQAQDECAAVITQTPTGGSILFPPNGDNYEDGIECSWVIGTEDTGMHIHMTLQWKDIEYNPSCWYDMLQITTLDHTEVARICGTSSTWESFHFPHNMLRLNFESDGSINGKGFFLNYTIAVASSVAPVTATAASSLCDPDDQIKEENGGTIEYPGENRNYPDDAYCYWDIGTDTPNMWIEMTINWKDIEAGEDCPYDALEIRTVDGVLLESICGMSNTPETLVFPHNKLRLIFRSDDSINGMGFNLTYVFTPPGTLKPTSASGMCRAVLVQNDDGGSLLFPPQGLYDNNAYCSWSIGAPRPGMHILLTLVSKDIEYHSYCGYDSLEFRNLDGLELEMICGQSNVPEVFHFPYDQLEVVFVSDSSNVGRGFDFNYVFVPATTGLPIKPTTSTDMCLATQTTSPQGGVLQYPANGKYPDDAFCRWDIGTHDTSKGIEIVLLWKDIEYSADCDYDWLEIRTADNDVLERICGTDNDPQTLIYPHNELILVFASDLSVNGFGFSLTYSFVDKSSATGKPTKPPKPTDSGMCEATFITSATSGSLQYPPSGLYPHNAHCTWTIGNNEPGTRIELVLLWKDIEDDPSCSYDVLVIRAPDGSLLEKICGECPTPETFNFPYGQLQLTFTSDNIINGAGFSLEYNVINVGIIG